MALLFQEKKVVFVGQYYNGAYVTPNINKLSVEEVDSFAVSERKEKGWFRGSA